MIVSEDFYQKLVQTCQPAGSVFSQDMLLGIDWPQWTCSVSRPTLSANNSTMCTESIRSLEDAFNIQAGNQSLEEKIIKKNDGLHPMILFQDGVDTRVHPEDFILVKETPFPLLVIFCHRENFVVIKV